MPACFMASGRSRNLSRIMRNRLGRVVPDRERIRVICAALVTGMIPASTGTVMPTCWARYRKLYRALLSKNIWVTRKSTPQSTFSFKWRRSSF